MKTFSCNISLAVTLLTAMLLAGCATRSTVETRKQERYPAYAALPTEQQSSVDQSKISVGMNMDAVYIAWGSPAEILEGELEGKVDEKWVDEWADFGDEFEALSRDIADKIKEKCKATLDVPRYKIIVQVTVGQMKDQGVKITSRCLWDTATDNYTTASFQNQP